MSIRPIAVAATLLAGGLLPLAANTAASALPEGPGVPGSTSSARSLCAPPADTVGPVATMVTFGHPSIDLNSGSRVEPITVEASDTSGNGAASGVANVWLNIQGGRSYDNARLKLTSGTAASGTWTGSVTVSKYARPGTYSITNLDLIDADGNRQEYPGYGKVPSGPNALSLHPADDPTFTVTGTPAKRPPRKPAGTLARFSISRTHVDTTASVRHVQFGARFAGAAPSRVEVEVQSVKRSSKARFVYLGARLHEHHGSWSGQVTIPRWLGKQTLQTHLFADFGRGYRPGYRDYEASQLHRRHFANSIAVISGVDKTRPKITSLSLSPDPIDSTAGAEKVTVTAQATDTGSGVRSININGNIRNGVNGVAAGSYPYSSAGVGYISFDDFSVRLKKTADGSWVGTTTVRKCVPSGTYKLNAELRDVAGNFNYVTTKALAKAGITSTVDVTSKHGDVSAPYVYSAATYGADHQLFLNFSEGVKEINTSTLTVYALSPQSSRYTTPTPIDAIVCSNGTTAVDCSGSGGAVTSAVLTINGMTHGQKYEVWGNLNQVTPQLTDANGNPLDWNYAATDVIDS